MSDSAARASLRARLESLEQRITARRSALMDRVLAARIGPLAVVLEDIYQPHNAAAVLRSCEAFGVQRVHVIEGRNAFAPAPAVVMGADRWLTLRRWGGVGSEGGTRACLEFLKDSGYRIAATTLREGAVTPAALPLDRPLALAFGTELSGLSACAHEMADVCVQLPMYGFTQSFNISVSAALCLQGVTERVRAAGGNWGLSEQERLEIKTGWILRMLGEGDAGAAAATSLPEA